MNRNKWIISLILLPFVFIFMANFVAIIIYSIAKIYLYFIRDIPFLTYLPGLYKVMKGASFGGIVAGIGCWYVYYRNEHS